MSETNRKEYDLELRTLKFAKEVRDFCMADRKSVV